jgi:hypothetical protein
MGLRRKIADAAAGFDYRVVPREEYMDLLTAKADLLKMQAANGEFLATMMRAQRELYDLNGQPAIDYGRPLGHRAKKEVQRTIQEFVRSAIHECVELEDFTAWKSWSVQLGNKWPGERWSVEHIRMMRMEVVDILAFVMNLCCILGMDAKMLYLMYMEKRAINGDRHDSGTY